MAKRRRAAARGGWLAGRRRGRMDIAAACGLPRSTPSSKGVLVGFGTGARGVGRAAAGQADLRRARRGVAVVHDGAGGDLVGDVGPRVRGHLVEDIVAAVEDGTGETVEDVEASRPICGPTGARLSATGWPKAKPSRKPPSPRTLAIPLRWRAERSAGETLPWMSAAVGLGKTKAGSWARPEMPASAAGATATPPASCACRLARGGGEGQAEGEVLEHGDGAHGDGSFA